MTNSARIGVIHTTPATVDLFGRLLRERIPGADVVNLLDDSILPELRDNGADLSAVEPRWRDYVRIVSGRGVDVILNACSSIGELCAHAQGDVPQPIIRVDAGMVREAMTRGTRIGVIATLATTLGPTGRLVLETATEQGQSVDLDSVLVEGAYAALMAGDQARHDDLIAAALGRATQSNDVIMLAQASMARVLPRLDETQQRKVLTSPPYAVEDIARVLERGSDQF
jgi:Asp/Glu/hydantoin racemase